MKRFKKILKITVITLIVIIGVLISFPFIFKKQIVNLVKSEVNKTLNAKVDFADVDISLFRSFPRVSVALEGLYLVGVDDFSTDTLISAKSIDVALNIMSVIKQENMKIYAIEIDEPRIHAIVHRDGRPNWDIMQPSDETATDSKDSSKPFHLNLQKYAIHNGYIEYRDEPGNMNSEIINLNHEGEGDFTADLFTLVTKTTADGISFNYGGIPYLTKTKTAIDADIKVDAKTNKYSFKTDKISLNNLKISSEGFFQMVNDEVYNMDIRFDAPSTAFKEILSLIPAVFKKDFASVKASGEAKFNGFVKGIYSSKEIPAYKINLDVKNGFFQYPDLPKPVKNINLEVKIDNPDGVTDHTVINIPTGHIELGNDPFDFRLIVKNPVSDPFIDANARGKLDLSSVGDFVKLEPGTKLTGLLNADVDVSGRINAIEKQQYEKFKASGTIDLRKFFYASKDYPDGISLNSLVASLNPKNITLTNVDGSYMNTNFTANGAINNLVAYIMKNQPLEGKLDVKADKVNLDDYMSTSSDTATTSAQASTASQAFVVPGNIKFVVNSNVDEVHYDKMDIHDLSGSLNIADETVKLSQVKGKALDGTIQVNGSYSTKEDKKNPDIALTYDVQDVDVQKTFYAFNTVQKLMPVGQFISGKLNSQLSFTGKLDGNMMPDLNSLTGKGNLLLIQGFLSKFKPLEQMAHSLQVSELMDISMKDVKNYIEFKNGKVFVKPFKMSYKGIDMEIGGMHGFDQTMDYVINLKIPRKLMGEKGNEYVNSLVTQVNNKGAKAGVKAKVPDMIPLQVKLGGTLQQPLIKTDLKKSASNLADDLKQQATDFAKHKIDSTKQAVTKSVKDTAEVVKKQLIKDAQDELKTKLFTSKDSAQAGGGFDNSKKKIEESGKGLLNNLLGKKKKDTTKTH